MFKNEPFFALFEIFGIRPEKWSLSVIANDMHIIFENSLLLVIINWTKFICIHHDNFIIISWTKFIIYSSFSIFHFCQERVNWVNERSEWTKLTSGWQILKFFISSFIHKQIIFAWSSLSSETSSSLDSDQSQFSCIHQKNENVQKWAFFRTFWDFRVHAMRMTMINVYRRHTHYFETSSSSVIINCNHLCKSSLFSFVIISWSFSFLSGTS